MKVEGKIIIEVETLTTRFRPLAGKWSMKAIMKYYLIEDYLFPSPCGEMVNERHRVLFPYETGTGGFRPLAGKWSMKVKTPWLSLPR